MAYSEKVIDHYENPRNVGSFDSQDPTIGSGMVGAPACGDVMKLQIKVNEAGIIEDARFKTYGCGSAIASSSLVTEWMKGKSLDQAEAIKILRLLKNWSYRQSRFTAQFWQKMLLKPQSPTTKQAYCQVIVICDFYIQVTSRCS